MFRRQLIGQSHRVLERLHLNQPGVVLEHPFDIFPPRQLRQLLRDFPLDRPEHPARSGHQPDAFVAGTMFRLRQQIRRRKARIRRGIGQHQHFTRARQQINLHPAHQQPLGGPT